MATTTTTAIKAHIHLEGGKLLSEANAHRIFARSTRPTDRWGNRLPTCIEGFRNDPPYFQTWTIKWEEEGYIFREVNNGSGICGCHATVRDLVIATLCGICSDIVVEVLQEDFKEGRAA